MIRCATLSLTATDSKEANINKAIALCEQAVQQHQAEWIVLPEVFSCFGSAESVRAAAEDVDGPLATKLSCFARDNGVSLFAGSFQEKITRSDLVYNTMLVFGPDGQQLARYRKTHLFSLSSGDGRKLYDETISYAAGDQSCPLIHQNLKVCLAICYDLRFPGFFEAMYRQHGAPDVIVIPAAFTYQTGKDHWLTLLRARAIEYQCYVIAANQVGLHDEVKRSYGHSVIIDPWGTILVDSGDEPGAVAAELSLEQIAHVRAKVPALANRRDDIY